MMTRCRRDAEARHADSDAAPRQRDVVRRYAAVDVYARHATPMVERVQPVVMMRSGAMLAAIRWRDARHAYAADA